MLDTVLSSGEFLGGGTFSAADFMMAYTLIMVMLFQLFDANDHPNIGAWLNKIESRPAWKLAVGT